MTSKRAPADPRGGHTRLYWALQDSCAWRALSWADQGLYVAMRRKLLGSNNGNIEATLGTLRHADITSSATLAKGLRALMTAGFIDKTRQGGVAYGQKSCSLYRFTDERVFDHPKHGIKGMPATNDWQAFKTDAEARAAVRKAHADAKRQPAENKSGLQKLNGASSENELNGAFLSSVSEAESPALVQKLKQTANGRNRAESRANTSVLAIETRKTDRAPTASETEHLCIVATPGVAAGGSVAGAVRVPEAGDPGRPLRSARPDDVEVI
jgi:hypothetical protein